MGKEHKTEPPYTGPYEIIELRGANKYTIKDLASGGKKLSHSERFKRCQKRENSHMKTLAKR